MGANRARQVAATEGAELVAVCDLDRERLDRVALEHECPGTTDYHELLGRDDVHVIYVMTPSGLHAQVAIDAAQAGKHVITTKPMETRIEKADAMIEACQKAGVKLLVDFELRYASAANKIKAALGQGCFGSPILAEVRLKWYRGDAYYDGWHGTWGLDGGGALINQTVHQVDLLCWFMGLPQTVRGRIGVYNHDIETEDMSLAMLHYASGAEGMIVATTTFPEGQPPTVEIHGTRGGVILAGDQITYWKTDEDCDVLVPSHPTCAAQDMVQALRQGHPLRCDGHEGKKSLALVRAVYESAQREELVTVVEGSH
jgi:predicted dehydrogenase